MRHLKYLLIVACAVCLAACSDDDDFQESILGVAPEPQTELDNWIWDNFTEDFNIRVVYKWKTFEVTPELNLVPVEEQRVIPFLDVIWKVWMQPYIQLGGEVFFKETAPKQIVLVGSIGFMEAGVYLLGEAERGRRITILGLNTRPLDRMRVEQFTHDFHHEYIHILNQLKSFPPAFETISAGEYTTSWSQYSHTQALQMGFISNYAMADVNEDFAEMGSYFVYATANGWENRFLTAGQPGSEPYRKLKEKETIMLQYMKSMYNIDMYALRALVQEAMSKVIAEL
ncbi:MAG: putative zinc-binding metallopeptidase [Odoribacteraceae bacterium]|jgi:substrate import-associated zinc metallohydrolase lipoprotein|nr:putative zinc-binding metallopeptidase [Odoribacteraceae bacterium]